MSDGKEVLGMLIVGSCGAFLVRLKETVYAGQQTLADLFAYDKHERRKRGGNEPETARLQGMTERCPRAVRFCEDVFILSEVGLNYRSLGWY